MKKYIIYAIIILAVSVTGIFIVIKNTENKSDNINDTLITNQNKKNQQLESNKEIAEDQETPISYEKITGIVKVIGRDGNPLTIFPIRTIQPSGPQKVNKKTAAQYNIFNSDENGIIKIITYAGDDVFVLSAHPDYRIDDAFCEYNDSIDCRYSLKNFNYLNLRGPGKASEAQGHRTLFKKDGETKEIVLRVYLPRISDVTYFNKERYSDNRRCGGFFSNYNKSIHNVTMERISKNINYNKYIDKGYALRDLCDYNHKTILFMDYGSGYMEQLGKVTDEELSELAQKIVIGFTNKTFVAIDFFETELDEYRFEGTGQVACNIENFKDDYVLYICDDGHDSGKTRIWYAYDMEEKENIKVKDYVYIYDDKEGKISGKVYEQEILSLFTEKEGK